MADVNIDTLKTALTEQGFDITSEKFVMALRKAQNPGGCEWCGARTKLAHEVLKGKTKILELACCGRKVG